MLTALKTKWKWGKMSFQVNKKRRETMLTRIGDAATLIDDQRFLPFYRSVQIKLEKLGKADEWGRMIATAKTKENPSKYFARICKMVRDGTYKFVEKVAEIASNTKLYISDKLVRFGFGKFQPFYVRKAHEFIQANGQAGFVELLEYAERKGVTQKYMAKALINGKSPREHYRLNIMGAK
jgi:hypothetical protein